MKHQSIVCLLILLAAVLLCGCSPSEPEILFDEVSEGIVSVILKDYNDGTIHYDTIGPDSQRQETAPFGSDPIEIVSSDFEAVGNETDLRVIELAQAQDYTIETLRILRLGEHRFVTVEWAVNFWDPHTLYYYDPIADSLTELYTYDATQVVGLKILNLPRS